MSNENNIIIISSGNIFESIWITIFDKNSHKYYQIQTNRDLLSESLNKEFFGKLFSTAAQFEQYLQTIDFANPTQEETPYITNLNTIPSLIKLELYNEHNTDWCNKYKPLLIDTNKDSISYPFISTWNKERTIWSVSKDLLITPGYQAEAIGHLRTQKPWKSKKQKYQIIER